MGCEKNTCETKSGSTKDNSCQSSGCEMTDKLVHLAERAWEELLIEKMKVLLQEHNGARMDRVAKATVEVTNAYWEHKMAAKSGCQEAKQKIAQAFMG